MTMTGTEEDSNRAGTYREVVGNSSSHRAQKEFVTTTTMDIYEEGATDGGRNFIPMWRLTAKSTEDR